MYNNEEKIPKIGDVYLMDFGGSGNEQQGLRPGLILQNNIGNTYSPNIIALPLTSSLKKRHQPTHVVLPAESTGLLRDSMVLCENPETIAKDKLGKYLITLPKKYMSRIAAAHLLATSAISYISPEDLFSIWQQATALNSIEPHTD